MPQGASAVDIFPIYAVQKEYSINQTSGVLIPKPWHLPTPPFPPPHYNPSNAFR